MVWCSSFATLARGAACVLALFEFFGGLFVPRDRFQIEHVSIPYKLASGSPNGATYF